MDNNTVNAAIKVITEAEMRNRKAEAIADTVAKRLERYDRRIGESAIPPLVAEVIKDVERLVPHKYEYNDAGTKLYEYVQHRVVKGASTLFYFPLDAKSPLVEGNYDYEVRAAIAWAADKVEGADSLSYLDTEARVTEAFSEYSARVETDPSSEGGRTLVVRQGGIACGPVWGEMDTLLVQIMEAMESTWFLKRADESEKRASDKIALRKKAAEYRRLAAEAEALCEAEEVLAVDEFARREWDGETAKLAEAMRLAEGSV